MMVFGTWRSLQSVMLVTLHVAVVASLIRSWTRPASLLGSFFLWVPLAILLALFFTGPASKALASAFDPSSNTIENRCPKCRRPELRPVVRSKGGIFQPVSDYRCAACWTTFRQEGMSLVELPEPSETKPARTSGIEFLAEPPSIEGEIRFLDDPDSPC